MRHLVAARSVRQATARVVVLVAQMNPMDFAGKMGKAIQILMDLAFQLESNLSAAMTAGATPGAVACKTWLAGE